MNLEGRSHVKAFCLMWYQCKECSHTEQIWNSRDGVTPFGAQCPSCGGSMWHISWHMDKYAPNHKLHFGQKFWRDASTEEWLALFKANGAASSHAYARECHERKQPYLDCYMPKES